jgi:hypothetical protein
MHRFDARRLIVNWKEESHAAAVRHGIARPDRFVAQIEVESDGFDLEVINQQRFGSTGGRGIARLMTPTGNWVASMIGVGPKDFWASPARQLEGAAWLMQRLLSRYDNSGPGGSGGRGGEATPPWVFALAAYHAGVGNLARWLDPMDSLMPFEDTIHYVGRIMRLSPDEVRERLLTVEAGLVTSPVAPRPAYADPGASSGIVRADPASPCLATTPPARARSASGRAALKGGAPMPSLALDPNAPDLTDSARWTPWTCSLHTIQQALEAVGSSMSYADVFHLIVDARHLADADLHDSTGQSLAKLFRDLGYSAFTEYPVDFDGVWEDAGHEPICLSINGHDRWMFVRSRADDNTLNLSNSAPGHMGVEQTLTRWQWAQIGGGAAAVYLDIPEGEDPSVIAALQARLVELASVNAELGRQLQDRETQLTATVERLAHISDVIVPAMVSASTRDARAALAEEVFEIRQDKVGPRPAGASA